MEAVLGVDLHVTVHLQNGQLAVVFSQNLPARNASQNVPEPERSRHRRFAGTSDSAGKSRSNESLEGTHLWKSVGYSILKRQETSIPEAMMYWPSFDNLILLHALLNSYP